MPPLSHFLQIPTKSINQDTLCLVGVVTLLSGFQLASFAKRVGHCRRKYKITPPRIDGEEAFQRCFRAQQNCLEFFPIFMTVLWLSGIFFHQLPASLLGLYYLYERENYFVDYSRNSDGRITPFRRSAQALRAMALFSALGLFNILVRHVFHWDLLQTLTDTINVPL
ncbi:microsomal glutathione S-transferase 2-like [Paramacrobiotus metropolitanus]|uniref:microsomal glutathione S-transferase 2-like n=1 Tax=Paramacrobiotus metropolitanus TaxID=2943436 RepID=UPI0024459CFC|nr:microsomal glutathione S-transferase 2-like [Paramacrobiotus metropolitanus]